MCFGMLEDFHFPFSRLQDTYQAMVGSFNQVGGLLS